MSFTYDVSTNLGKVRLLISDVDQSDYVFEDEELDAILELEAGVKSAAAHAFEVIAGNEVLVQKRIRLLDLTTDGPAEAKALLDIADKWRAQSASDGDSDEDEFAIAETVWDEFTLREHLENERMRNA